MIRQRTLDRSMQDFLQEAGAATPTPGGGSVAALVGSLGAAMASMAANFTKGVKFAALAEQVESALARLQHTSLQCEDLLEADIVSFERYMQAMKLPKSTDEEQAIRKHALHEASLEAIAIPMRLMEVCRDALTLTGELAPCANKNVISDLGIGALLFEAAAQSALLTVEINLAAMPDSEQRQQFELSTLELIRDIICRKESAVEQVRHRIRNMVI